MNELIEVRGNEAVCTSLDVAERFHKRHDNVLRIIGDLLKIEVVKNATINEPQIGLVKMFSKSTYKDAKGETRPMYYMNRDGFSLLVMGFTGKDALEWKLKYINAFNQMEKLLYEKQTTTWIDQRNNNKAIRRSETDAIKLLVEYAELQGSEHATRYYTIFSKLADKAVGITDRNLATVIQLAQLIIAESLIKAQIESDIANGVYYKDIYNNCKNRLAMMNMLQIGG